MELASSFRVPQVLLRLLSVAALLAGPTKIFPVLFATSVLLAMLPPATNVFCPSPTPAELPMIHAPPSPTRSASSAPQGLSASALMDTSVIKKAIVFLVRPLVAVPPRTLATKGRA